MKTTSRLISEYTRLPAYMIIGFLFDYQYCFYLKNDIS